MTTCLIEGYAKALERAYDECEDLADEVERLQQQLAVCRAEQGPRIALNIQLQEQREEARAEATALRKDLTFSRAYVRHLSSRCTYEVS